MQFACRRSLLTPAERRGGRTVLLEGSWDFPASSSAPDVWGSLDAFLWPQRAALDQLASRFAAMVESSQFQVHGSLAVPWPWLQALRLRYALVKLLRVSTYLQQCPAGCESLRLVAGPGDEDYVRLLTLWCQAHGRACRIEWRDDRPVAGANHPPNRLGRRVAHRVLSSGARHWSSAPPPHRGSVALVGNPTRLGAVAQQFAQRGLRPVWLVDRFGWKLWQQGLSHGAHQAVCNSALGRAGDWRQGAELPELFWAGVDHAPAVATWLENLLEAEGPRMATLLTQVFAHWRDTKPRALVLDEDVTPLARAAVAAARAHDTPSWVVQHGAPCVRFGFTPMAADYFCAWGAATRRQMLAWGAAPEQLKVTGSPWHESWLASTTRTAVTARTRQVLLLNTVPPRDRRPDAWSLDLTTASYRELLQSACRAVQAWENAELVIRTHPRSGSDPVLDELLCSQPAGRVRLADHADLAGSLCEASMVVACASSAGIDAAAAGWPVIQLLPPGAEDILPAAEWGFVGAARSAADLVQLLRTTENLPEHAADSATTDALAQPTEGATATIVAMVLEHLAVPRRVPVAGLTGTAAANDVGRSIRTAGAKHQVLETST